MDRGNGSLFAHLDHMTKIAAMPYMLKTLKNLLIRSHRTLWPWVIVCGIGNMGPIKFEKKYNLQLTLTFLTERSNYFTKTPIGITLKNFLV